jgi:hypothetical protein
VYIIGIVLWLIRTTQLEVRNVALPMANGALLSVAIFSEVIILTLADIEIFRMVSFTNLTP